MRHRFADLVLSSEVVLAELPATSDGPAECFVRISPPSRPGQNRDGWDHHWRAPNGDVSLSCAKDGDRYRLGAPGLATFLIEDGGRLVTCRPVDALPAETLEHLLIDQVLPRVLTHLGRLVLHAGCVGTPQGAVAFLGSSGAGKSTLCAEFASEGHPLLSDDAIVVRGSPDAGIEAIPTYSGLRLLPAPLALMFDDHAGAMPVAHYTPKRRVDRVQAALMLVSGPQPLHAVYVLEQGETVTITSLPAREAFMALVQSSFQLHLDDPVRSRTLFEGLGSFIDAVPVRRLSYPREFARLSAVREAVLADVAGPASRASSAGCACS